MSRLGKCEFLFVFINISWTLKIATLSETVYFQKGLNNKTSSTHLTIKVSQIEFHHKCHFNFNMNKGSFTFPVFV